MNNSKFKKYKNKSCHSQYLKKDLQAKKMWEVFKNAQNMRDIVDKYKDLVDQYKTFGYDLLNIKDDLEFYLSVLPAIFLTAAFVHLYYFRKAQTKIAKLQGIIEAKDKEITFFRDLLEKKIGVKKQQENKPDQKAQNDQNFSKLLKDTNTAHLVDDQGSNKLRDIKKE